MFQEAFAEMCKSQCLYISDGRDNSYLITIRSFFSCNFAIIMVKKSTRLCSEHPSIVILFKCTQVIIDIHNARLDKVTHTQLQY